MEGMIPRTMIPMLLLWMQTQAFVFGLPASRSWSVYETGGMIERLRYQGESDPAGFLYVPDLGPGQFELRQEGTISSVTEAPRVSIPDEQPKPKAHWWTAFLQWLWRILP